MNRTEVRYFVFWYFGFSNPPMFFRRNSEIFNGGWQSTSIFNNTQHDRGHSSKKSVGCKEDFFWKSEALFVHYVSLAFEFEFKFQFPRQRPSFHLEFDTASETVDAAMVHSRFIYSRSLIRLAFFGKLAKFSSFHLS